MAKEFNIGDKVYFTKDFEEIYARYFSSKSNSNTHLAHERKIVNIVHTKSETLYQVSDGHFPESWIGKIVFKTKEEAEKHIE